MSQVLDAVKQLITKMNDYGIPLPLLRLNGKPTLTGTMAVLSFTTAILGQVGKLAGFLGGIDTSQANYLFMIALGAYLGRRLQDPKVPAPDATNAAAPTSGLSPQDNP